MEHHTTKTRIWLYRISTALLAAAFVFGGISDLLRAPAVLEVMHRLGYPEYFASLLGTWKLLGALAICLPALPRIKEWAYAGMFFDLTGAIVSHAAASDAASTMVPPLVLLVLLVVSYGFRPVSRRVATPLSSREGSNIPFAKRAGSVVVSSSLLVVLLASVAACSRSERSREATDDAASVVAFWREAGPTLWFAKDPAFDRRFRQRFLSLHEAAAKGELDQWQSTPEGALALVVLLDQFPRNSFRGTSRMYATDEAARKVANAAIAAGHDKKIDRELRVFMYLPFGHSESLADQERAVQLVARALGEPHLSHAKHHRDIVRRFGRFPHRNPILGRPMRPEEQRYLDEGGYQG